MAPLLTDRQRERREAFAALAARVVAPAAAAWDRDQRIADEAIAALADAGLLGCVLPRELGGLGEDVVTFGLLNEALGRHSSAFTGVLTVQTMVGSALAKWGTDAQRRAWLPKLARGETIAAFALTEPGCGSDLGALALRFVPDRGGDAYVVTGRKKWITCAQRAGVFLAFGRLDDGRPIAALVPRDTPGLAVEPIVDLMGFRAAGLGQLVFDGAVVPATNVVGKPGFALTHVAPVGLQYGRISTACSALGLLRGCVEESGAWASARPIGGRPAADLGMVRTLVARMGADLAAASFLCHDACRAEDERVPEAFEKVLTAKYFVSRAAVRAASDAVQVHGAIGCSAESPVSRFYRDAKILEIIEGTTQVHEELLGRMIAGRYARH
jgi:alkylation response protein AidB-like acyl-CoA dehydrogenase